MRLNLKRSIQFTLIIYMLFFNFPMSASASIWEKSLLREDLLSRLTVEFNNDIPSESQIRAARLRTEKILADLEFQSNLKARAAWLQMNFEYQLFLINISSIEKCREYADYTAHYGDEVLQLVWSGKVISNQSEKITEWNKVLRLIESMQGTVSTYTTDIALPLDEKIDELLFTLLTPVENKQNQNLDLLQGKGNLLKTKISDLRLTISQAIEGIQRIGMDSISAKIQAANALRFMYGNFSEVEKNEEKFFDKLMNDHSQLSWIEKGDYRIIRDLIEKVSPAKSNEPGIIGKYLDYNDSAKLGDEILSYRGDDSNKITPKKQKHSALPTKVLEKLDEAYDPKNESLTTRMNKFKELPHSVSLLLKDEKKRIKEGNETIEFFLGGKEINDIEEAEQRMKFKPDASDAMMEPQSKGITEADIAFEKIRNSDLFKKEKDAKQEDDLLSNELKMALARIHSLSILCAAKIDENEDLQPVENSREAISRWVEEWFEKYLVTELRLKQQ